MTAVANSRGRVQGVCCRAWIDHEARARDLEGLVRNLGDGMFWIGVAMCLAAITIYVLSDLSWRPAPRS